MASARSRSNSRKPSSGATKPMLAGIGSARIAAIGSLGAVAARSAWASFQGTIAVVAAADAGTPGLEGSDWVAKPDPAWASKPSTWPW